MQRLRFDIHPWFLQTHPSTILAAFIYVAMRFCRTESIGGVQIISRAFFVLPLIYRSTPQQTKKNEETMPKKSMQITSRCKNGMHWRRKVETLRLISRCISGRMIKLCIHDSCSLLTSLLQKTLTEADKKH